MHDQAGKPLLKMVVSTKSNNNHARTHNTLMHGAHIDTIGQGVQHRSSPEAEPSSQENMTMVTSKKI
jgi:hypothetical protein